MEMAWKGYISDFTGVEHISFSRSQQLARVDTKVLKNQSD